MPTLTDLPQKELRNFDVALKVFQENFGKIHNPTGDGNCGYYVLFKAFKFLGRNLMGKKLVRCAANQKTARTKRIKLLKFGLKEVNNFVWHPDNSIRPKLIQLLPDSHSHIFGSHSPNLVTKQDKINAFMATIGDSIYTKAFDNQDGEELEKDFYLEASSTWPLVCYKWKINITLYNVDNATTNYFITMMEPFIHGVMTDTVSL